MVNSQTTCLLALCTLFCSVDSHWENTHVNRDLKPAGRLHEDASRIIIETYLRPLRSGTVPLTTSNAFPVITARSQCHLKETPELLSPHGSRLGHKVKERLRRLNEGLGARMGNSRDDDGCECPRSILAPYGGYRRLKGSTSSGTRRCHMCSAAALQDSGGPIIDILTDI